MTAEVERSERPGGASLAREAVDESAVTRVEHSAGPPPKKTAKSGREASDDDIGLGPGTMVDGLYRIVGELGRGGMGVVFHAMDERLERSVAIKFVRPELLDRGELRERFLSEARAMARVRHPHVLPIYALGEHQGMPYFVTAFVEGQTVERWLASRAPGALPDLAVAQRILEDACRGVAAIHAAATVHRDVKPSNLLLDAQLRVLVADMGVADLLRRTSEKHGELVGTPEYMAPEIVLQEPVSAELAHLSDVYSLGCLAFELFTGRAPYGGGSSGLARMMAHVIESAPKPSEIRPELPSALDDVVLRALAKDPRDRTPSADAFRRAVASAFQGLNEPTRILIADDDDDFCELLESCLHNEFPDAAIERASDGSTALEAFDRELPSIAILDLGMPHLGGMQLTEALRARVGAERIPILVLTASGGPAEWKRLASMGADGFLVKPVNLKDVVTLVRRSLVERMQSLPPPADLPG